MKPENLRWNKKELEIYILLVCAKSDSETTEEELQLIRAKTDAALFEKVTAEFNCDTEEECLEKIKDTIAWLDYTNQEIKALRKEMHEVFFSDKKFVMMEQHMDRILDSMIY